MRWALATMLGAGGVAGVAAGEEAATPPPEPRAAERPVRFERHGDVRIDPWHWLRERENPEVRAYLEAENAYLEAALAPVRALEERILAELTARVAPEDQSAPWRRGGFLYYSRFEPGREYALHCRRAGDLAAAEQVLLDGNALAAGAAFFALAEPEPSPSGRYLAFAVDRVGRRIYEIRVKDLATGELLPDRIEATTGSLVWAADDRTLFYLRQDPETLRADRLYRHRLGTPAAADPLVYREADETFSLRLDKTRSERYLVLCARQTLATECRLLEADRPEEPFRVVEPRRRGHEYDLEHEEGPDGGRFLFRTNDGARNFRLMAAPVATPGREAWRELLPGSEEVLIEDVQAYRGRIVVRERSAARTRLRVLDPAGRERRTVAFDEPAFVVDLDGRAEYDGPLRFRYASLTTPWSVYEEDPETSARTLVKREPVLGGFDPADYRTERLWAPARDGRRVPVTLLLRRTTPTDGTAPLLVRGYGSYGYSSEPIFDSTLLSLVDRGFVFAIAHVRGGEELGRTWYEEGRQLAKPNTFHDFVDATEHLQRAKRGDPQRTYAIGGSAGGLLIGAVLNLRPDLYDGAIALVPFVDVVSTMLDPSIPLTTSEYDEWGDPNDPAFYRVMRSYSPYDNVAPKAYPSLLVMTGFHDSQVQYWEPAKWVARLRALRTDRSKLLLLKTNFEAGHGGASGRYRRLADRALQTAFLVHLAERPR